MEAMVGSIRKEVQEPEAGRGVDSLAIRAVQRGVGSLRMLGTVIFHGKCPSIRRSSCGTRVPALILATFMVTACGNELPDSESDTSLQVDGAKLVVTDSGARDVGNLRFLGYATGTTGPEATERITAVASTNRPDVIVVADLPSCAAHFIDLTTQRQLREVGRCGEGPGEVSFLSGVAEFQDTTYLFEANRKQVLAIDSQGTEVRREQLLQALPDGFDSFNWNAMLSPGEYLLTRSIGPEATAGTLPGWKTPLVVANVNDTPATVTGLPVGLSKLTVRTATTFVRPNILRACVQRRDRSHSGGHIVVTHGLALESVVLDRSHRASVHTLTPADWMTPSVDSTGRLVLAVRRWYVACGESLYAIGVRDFDGRDERGTDTRGYLEVRRYDGSLVASRLWGTLTPGSPRVGAPKLILGDTLVTVVVDSAGWQRLALWRVGE